MDSYRVKVRAATEIDLADEDAEIEPVPTSGGGRLQEPELDRLSNIVRAFNEQFGNLGWKDQERIVKTITEEVPPKVAANKAYQNAIKNSDKQNARIEHDKALQRVLVDLLTDHTELFKHFSDNPSFKRWLSDVVFSETYKRDPSRLCPDRPRAGLERRLQASDDPVDGLSLSLLGTLAREHRLSFADALALAGEKGLSEMEAYIAIERLARPSAAGIRRYYIDHSTSQPRLLTPDEVHEQLIAERPESELRNWMKTIEVTWADSEKNAMGLGGAS